MPLSRSAHVDTFTRDRLPPQDQWPELRFDLPELDYPDRLNCAVRLLDETIERIGRDQRCLVTDAEEWTYGSLLERANQVADDVALLALTSGTTGRPKVTMHFHRDVPAIADTFSRHVLRPEPDDLFTTTAPFAFTFGLGAGLVFPLHTGAATLLIEKATPDELVDAIARQGVTALFTAPTAYKAMVAAGKGAQLRSVRRAVSAGEHLPEATWRAFYEATDVRIIHGIGSTEMLHIFIASAGDDIRPGSTGKAVP